LEFIFRFLPREQWELFDRRSAIDFGAYSIDYPIESNIWQLPLERQVDYLQAIAFAGENMGEPAPVQFHEWILWKLGSRISEDYMLPYNRKIWSMDIDRLGTYWIEKLPFVSFREVLMSCLSKKPFGQIPAHKTSYYPKNYGYGEVWDRMGNGLGDHLLLSSPARTLNIRSRTVNGHWQAEKIINTIPWPALHLEDIPETIQNTISSLVHTGIRIDYHQENLDNPNHWIYLPDESIDWHRILNRRTFVNQSSGYWTETNTKRGSNNANTVHVNDFAYPVNTREKPLLMQKLQSYFAEYNVFGLGRWGTWEHINSDIAVKLGIEFAESMLNITSR
jgi:protoporphyrinogen oxidase